ncbi:MAG: acyl-CoA dehydrogenase family protein, partial [Planctomycetes bacterium]|nr:acyl-CoA dehydrogenase family protein [Planctomycetota bacterium]
MFDFEISEKHRNFQAMTHMFAEQVIRPIALKADEEHGYPDDVMMMLAQASAGGMADMEGAVTMAPDEAEIKKPAAAEKEKKKRSANMLMAILTEELAWGDPCACLNIPGPGLGGPPVRFVGTEEQQRRFFGPFRNMEKPMFGAYAYTEPGAGSDTAAIRASCRKDGKQWVINGTKCFITNGGRALWNVVFATVDATQGRDGIRIFVVEKGTPGASVGKIEQKMGLRASETAELVYEDCRVSEENLLGGEAHYSNKAGFKGAMKTFDSTRPLVAAMAVGIARAAWEIARDFVKEHYLTSRPVTRYRTLADTLARMQREIDTARGLTWRACWMADEGLPNSKEASMAKVYAA